MNQRQNPTTTGVRGFCNGIANYSFYCRLLNGRPMRLRPFPQPSLPFPVCVPEWASTIRHELWQAVCLVFMVASIPMPGTVLAEDVTPEEAAKIDELIEELASPNDPKKLIPLAQYLKFPPDWDHEGQARVYRAATSLVKKGRSAFPQLIAHAGDKRFSFVNKSGNGAMTPMSVGHACGRIIQVQLDVFDQIGIYPRMYPSYFGTVASDKDNDDVKDEEKLKNWEEKRKDKTLVDLQVESIEWAIEQQTQLLAEWKTDKRRDTFDLKALRNIIADNKKTLKKLRTTMRPIEREGHPFKIYEGK